MSESPDPVDDEPAEAHDGGGAESTVRRSADTAGEGASA
jgi:hypothetical protein